VALAPLSPNPKIEHEAGASAGLLKHKGRSTREGLKLVVPILAAAIGALASARLLQGGALRWTAAITSLVCVVSAAWVVRFFRDFQPFPRLSRLDVVSPAHGVVDHVENDARSNFLPDRCTRISIYLSLKNVHVQYAPVRGEVIHTEHIPGKRQRAIHQNASIDNEHLLVVIASAERPETRVVLRLIAGIWVRRIVPWCVRGELVSRSERLGLIRFGSRVDVYLPSECKLLVQVGDRVVGGETALARRPISS
jgi:phosphatidylserine decarboxylase